VNLISLESFGVQDDITLQIVKGVKALDASKEITPP
jgi:hypothetical protein